jgi:hypothetical protein
MLKEEFEKIAGAEISLNLYEDIERFYAGTNEDKYEFIGRMFGNKNTAKSIAVKYARFIIDDNRKALRGNPSATPERLRNLDRLLINHVEWLAKTEPWNGRVIKKWEFDLFNARLNGKKVFVWEASA